MLYEFILKLSAKNAWRGQFLRVSKSIWRVKCIAKSHEIEDEFYDFILTKQLFVCWLMNVARTPGPTA